MKNSRFHRTCRSVLKTYVANTVELARDDFHTQRGIRVGDTREAVKAAYPELKSGNYWAEYPGEDHLWYCEDEGD